MNHKNPARIIILGIAAAIIISWVMIDYWAWILGTAVIVVILWGVISYQDHKATEAARAARIRQEEEAEAARIRREEERIRQEEEAETMHRKQIIASADTFLHSFIRLLRQCVVIDSNIWMNDAYDAFFSVLSWACHKQQYVLTLFGPQFDEITNIKKNTEYGEKKNNRARLAINRIETFQKQNILNIRPVTIDSQRGAYADPLIVKLLVSEAKKGSGCTFFSDDIELRIRVHQHLKDQATGTWDIVELSELNPSCEIAVEAQEYREMV